MSSSLLCLQQFKFINWLFVQQNFLIFFASMLMQTLSSYKKISRIQHERKNKINKNLKQFTAKSF